MKVNVITAHSNMQGFTISDLRGLGSLLKILHFKVSVSLRPKTFGLEAPIHIHITVTTSAAVFKPRATQRARTACLSHGAIVVVATVVFGALQLKPLF